MADSLCQKSTLTWNDARACFDRAHFNTATNRYYYSVLQAVKAYLVEVGRIELNESYVESSDGKRISVHTLVVNEVKSQMYTSWSDFKKLRGLREVADYSPEAVDRDRLESLLLQAGRIRDHFLRQVSAPTT